MLVAVIYSRTKHRSSARSYIISNKQKLRPVVQSKNKVNLISGNFRQKPRNKPWIYNNAGITETTDQHWPNHELHQLNHAPTYNEQLPHKDWVVETYMLYKTRSPSDISETNEQRITGDCDETDYHRETDRRGEADRPDWCSTNE